VCVCVWGGLINFPPLKRAGLLEREGVIEDLRYDIFMNDTEFELQVILPE